jgi:hypothetical protein
LLLVDLGEELGIHHELVPPLKRRVAGTWTADDADAWWEAFAKSPPPGPSRADPVTSAAVTTDQVPLDVTGAFENTP